MKRKLGIALMAFGVLTLGFGGYAHQQIVDLTVLLIGSTLGLLMIGAGAFLVQSKGTTQK